MNKFWGTEWLKNIGKQQIKPIHNKSSCHISQTNKNNEKYTRYT